jgi:hypothetical protein
MLAEACGNRTHLTRVRRHAGFEDQESHQAQSASTLLIQQVATLQYFSGDLVVSIAWSRHFVEHADATLGMLRGKRSDGSDRGARKSVSQVCRQSKIVNRAADV